MKIYSIYDEAFRPYGRVVEGYPTQSLVEALEKTPLPEGVVYKAREEILHAAADAQAVGEALYGGMPFEFGYCNGHNTKMNCMEFHRDSEFNLGSEDFILLVARLDEVIDGVLDSACIKAFRAPAGVLVECFATTLHYAPCHADPARGFRVLIALPDGTNDAYRPVNTANPLDRMLWARNKWLLAHPDTSEAAEGAVVAIRGENIDIADSL